MYIAKTIQFMRYNDDKRERKDQWRNNKTREVTYCISFGCA
jgi:hypothetical protein